MRRQTETVLTVRDCTLSAGANAALDRLGGPLCVGAPLGAGRVAISTCEAEASDLIWSPLGVTLSAMAAGYATN